MWGHPGHGPPRTSVRWSVSAASKSEARRRSPERPRASLVEGGHNSRLLRSLSEGPILWLLHACCSPWPGPLDAPHPGGARAQATWAPAVWPPHQEGGDGVLTACAWDQCAWPGPLRRCTSHWQGLCRAHRPSMAIPGAVSSYPSSQAQPSVAGCPQSSTCTQCFPSLVFPRKQRKRPSCFARPPAQPAGYVGACLGQGCQSSRTAWPCGPPSHTPHVWAALMGAGQHCPRPTASTR